MFDDIFVNLLKAKKCTAADVSRATGISNGLLGDYRHGRKNPSPKNLSKIADFFGVSMDYLLGREPAESPGEALAREFPGLTPEDWRELRRYAAYLNAAHKA